MTKIVIIMTTVANSSHPGSGLRVGALDGPPFEASEQREGQKDRERDREKKNEIKRKQKSQSKRESKR